MDGLDVKIEAVLFYTTEPTSKKELASFFDVSAEDIEYALRSLSDRLTHGATRLIVTDTDVQIVSAPEVADIIEKIRKDELSKEIGRAGAETLAIVAYRGPVTRSEIDYIRGVNSTFILRNLLIRGLIERIEHPTLARSFQYRATPALYAHLGVTTREELPEFATVMNELDSFEKEHTKEKEEAPA